MDVGAFVAAGVTGVIVLVGACVFSVVGVGDWYVGRGGGVWDGIRVSDGLKVWVGALVLVVVRVGVGVMLGTAVGGCPSTVNRPDVFQDRPTNI